MKIHKEGYPTLLMVVSSLVILNIALYYLAGLRAWPMACSSGLSLLILMYFAQFFRMPERDTRIDDKVLYAPADGKLVVVEETEENEYFKDRRLQVSIFMSPYNVHSNCSPVNGELTYYKYHPGKFMVAWHPKSSELNERTTIVIKTDSGVEILLRQIAGAVARRIVFYPKVGDRLVQGEELGFIKFGSRVDLFLPVGTEIEPELGDSIRAGLTRLSNNFLTN